MSGSSQPQPKSLDEASAWFTRMTRTSVSTDDLRAFRDWRRDPAHAAAYAEVEAAWARAGGLARDPDIAAAAAEALARHPVRRRRPRGVVLWAGAGGLLATGLAAVWLLMPPSYSTRTGEQRLVVLADGSRVRLNTESALKVRYGRAERRVILSRGEAFFEAAHDAARPFVVEADGAQVRALGTRFDVRRDPQAVRVTLIEGRVQVAAGDRGGATLAPDQQLTVTARGVSAPTAAAPGATSWTSGRLDFRAVALQTAIAEVNRYAVRKIVLDGPAPLARQPVSGVFNTGDTQAFVSAVDALFDLRAVTGSDGSTHLVPKSAPSDG